MTNFVVLRADFYSNGTILPILITYADGKSEQISAVRETGWLPAKQEYIVRCSTPTRELLLRFRNMKWEICDAEL